MKPIAASEQQSLVTRLMNACGGPYSPETRRKFFITGPQWEAAYEGHGMSFPPTQSVPQKRTKGVHATYHMERTYFIAGTYKLDWHS